MNSSRNDWISVTDRLPEKWQPVLCWVPEKDYGVKIVVDYLESNNGIFARQFEWGAPTYWMPLPPPPVASLKIK